MEIPVPYGSPEPIEPAPAGSIVVGHDGSEGAQLALEMAMDFAGPLMAPVVIARAWSIITAPRPEAWSEGYVPPFDEFAQAVKKGMVEDALPVIQKYPNVQVSYSPVHAPPLKSLIDVSREARMLVVGTRGRGGLAGMLLGSVSEQCVRHASCAVLVVRDENTSRRHH
ncbi:universal stress protein UspA [Arthrobacter sp. MYb227]|uniref:universal stress protein n=1 Tax=Arthrobacter sp. MYb227 TaxID=1848601 RepID=UPI000CFACF85|nr:universal stress protein [Arthrobacter sp. MYb227]PQZ93035.1 universal stress protein UspA [Arthrobacter sp. MYb227]